jgi:large subunit ribosomal protein L4
MQLDIVNIEGQKTGRTIDLPEDIFGAEPNSHVIWLAVKQYLAAQRQGTHKVKTRAEAQGSSKKLHKQKGTGGSRKGNIRNPLYKGGGTVFGPKPHGYDIKLNRKVKDLAKIGALSAKAKDNKIIVVEDASMQIEKPNTKQFNQVFLKINNGSRKSLFVMPEYNENVYRSFRNVPSICGTLLSDINTYDIVNADSVIFTESAAKIFVDENEENNLEESANTEAQEINPEGSNETAEA